MFVIWLVCAPVLYTTFLRSAVCVCVFIIIMNDIFRRIANEMVIENVYNYINVSITKSIVDVMTVWTVC